MTNISFTSQIVPVHVAEFEKTIQKIDRSNFVNYPWTLKEAVVGTNVYTKGICDCTCIVISDGKKAAMLHLDPSQKSNHYMQNMIDFFKVNFSEGVKNLKAFVIGSKNSKSSQDIYNKWINFLTSYKVPFTVLKDGKNPTHVFYSVKSDKLLISNSSISKALKSDVSPNDAINSSFEYILLSKQDKI